LLGQYEIFTIFKIHSIALFTDAKLAPKNKIALMVESGKELIYVFEKNENLIKKEINASMIEYKRSAKFDLELETKIDEWPIWVGLRKIEN